MKFSRVGIWPAKYRGASGFSVRAWEPGTFRRSSIFTLTRDSAERIRDKLRSGEEIQLEDFE